MAKSKTCEGKRLNILVVDGDPAALPILKGTLEGRTADITFAANGEDALRVLTRRPVGIIIMELLLDGMSGFDLVADIRKTSRIPILVLSSLTDELGKCRALELGADDYLTKPFFPEELVARLRALLRRGYGGATDGIISAGDLRLNLRRRTATMSSTPLELTRMQFEILSVLARNCDQVVSTDSLLTEVWGTSRESNVASLRVHVSHVRSKLESVEGSKHRIVAESGVGYRLVTA